VRISAADLLPCDANLLPAYDGFAREAACEEFCAQVNDRVHDHHRSSPGRHAGRGTPLAAPPAHPSLHGRVRGDPRRGGQHPDHRHRRVLVFGPARLLGETVWVRYHGEEVIVTHVRASGPVEVYRHERTSPATPATSTPISGRSRKDRSTAPPGAPTRPRKRSLPSASGAALWLTEAGAAGVCRPRPKMADAVALAAPRGTAAVDRALGHAAVLGRFGDGDLASIVAHQPAAGDGPTRRDSEDHTLQSGTSAWEGFGG
jgi:hypothetical protein